MNILVLFSAVFLLLVTGVQAQAHRMDGKSLCSSCSVTVNKIAAVLDKQPQLKNDIKALRQAVQSTSEGIAQARIKAIFSGWSTTIEKYFEEEKDFRPRNFYRRLCIETEVCQGQDL